ncbi:MAG TPA: prepilin peptidase [Pseudomonas sp.]|nr:prepilin peptidase [Pseudomonas sp.]
MLIIILLAFLLGAVAYDVVSHRLPNYYLLLGVPVALALQAWIAGWAGVMAGGAGLLTGFALFIPFYAMGGMAAGDVKLMAVVGGFLGIHGVAWAAGYSFLVAGICGVAYLVHKGQLGKMFSRYWAMASLGSYIPADERDAARQRFPYAMAIAIGVLLSLCWTPI